MLSAISFALYVLIISGTFISIFSYKKIIGYKSMEYFDDWYFIENGVLEKSIFKSIIS